MAFGKRQLDGSLQSGQVSDRLVAARSSDLRSADLRAELAAGLQRSQERWRSGGDGIVPTSTVGFLAASLAVMVVHMAVLVIAHRSFAAKTAEVLQAIDGVESHDAGSFATLALFASVWSGARAAAAFTLPAHLILHALDVRSISAYALGATLASALWLIANSFSDLTLAGSANGYSLTSIDWIAACASGFMAGIIYRLVAGSRGRARS